MKDSTVNECRLIQLPKISNPAGNLTSINEMTDIGFSIKRVYYLYDIPGGEARGGHAHKDLHQLIVAASGSFTVMLDDGYAKRNVVLNQPYQGLLIIPGIWRELLDFSSGSICLVLASDKYDERDYIRDYDHFLSIKKA
ncbi:MAG: FdtA/QdtA family cupin domain-containing protein [Chitinophagaceae bacterium]